MKRIYYDLGIVFLLILAATGYGWTGSVYQGVYVDAAESNTVAVSGVSPWNSGTGDTAGLWKLRNTFGNNTNLWEANGNTSYLGDCPELVTTISGLLQGIDYDIYLIFWIPNNQNIRVRTGLSAGSLTEFNNSNSTLTGGVEGDRSEYQGLAGTAKANGSGQIKLYIDDIASTYRTWYDGATYKAKGVSNPTPADKATDIAGNQNQTLSWAMPTDPNNPSLPNSAVTKHYFYIRKNDPNLVDVAKQDVPVTSNPAAQSNVVFVDNNATYYWRVDESMNNSGPTDANTITGTVWSFSTTQTLPSFNPPYGTQPVSVIVNENTDAVLTAAAGVTAGEDASITYQWYKGASGVTTNPVSDETDHISGAATSQLTITTRAADMGSYWCRATNSNGTGDSNAATISVKRMLAHYMFDDNLNDSAGTNNGTMDSPVYEPGIDGKALTFNGAKYVNIGTAGYPNASDNGGLVAGTVSFWIKSSTTATQSFIGSVNTTDGTMLNIHYSNDNAVRLYLHNTAAQEMLLQFSSTTNIRNGAWRLLVFTWDSTAGQGTVYVDGRVVFTTTTATVISGFSAWQYPMYIGAQNNGGTAADIYTGAMDDFRVYNYPLTATEAAQLYVDFFPDVIICPENPTYDFNSDCKTNLEDLIEFASDWLLCNLVPNESCQ